MTSPVMTAFDSKPRRVRNIFICSGVVFCASSRMTKASFSVRPRMKAMRRDLDEAARDQLVGLLEVHHVVERVVERPQVRRDLLLHAAGEKPEPLARLDGRPREDDPLDLLLHQRADRQRHRQVGLAGPRRPDAEHDVVLADGVDVALLGQALGGDGPRAAGDQDRVVEDVAQVDAAVGAQRDGRAADVLRADRRAGAGHAVELLDQAARDDDVVPRADDGQIVAAAVDLRAGLTLDQLEVRVPLAEERQGDPVVLQSQALGDQPLGDGSLNLLQIARARALFNALCCARA